MRVRIMRLTHPSAWYKKYMYQVFNVYEKENRRTVFFISPDTPDLDPKLADKVVLKNDVEIVRE